MDIASSLPGRSDAYEFLILRLFGFYGPSGAMASCAYEARRAMLTLFLIVSVGAAAFFAGCDLALFREHGPCRDLRVHVAPWHFRNRPRSVLMKF